MSHKQDPTQVRSSSNCNEANQTDDTFKLPVAPPLRLRRIPTMRWLFIANEKAHTTERFMVVVESKSKRQLSGKNKTYLQGPKADYNLSSWRICQVPPENMYDEMEDTEKDSSNECHELRATKSAVSEEASRNGDDMELVHTCK